MRRSENRPLLAAEEAAAKAIVDSRPAPARKRTKRAPLTAREAVDAAAARRALEPAPLQRLPSGNGRGSGLRAAFARRANRADKRRLKAAGKAGGASAAAAAAPSPPERTRPAPLTSTYASAALLWPAAGAGPTGDGAATEGEPESEKGRGRGGAKSVWVGNTKTRGW